jgi:hypothetical protein
MVMSFTASILCSWVPAILALWSKLARHSYFNCELVHETLVFRAWVGWRAEGDPKRRVSHDAADDRGVFAYAGFHQELHLGQLVY